jgi:hypothetical protein
MSDTQKKSSPTPQSEIPEEPDEANRGPNLVLLYSLLALALLAAMAFAAMVVWPFYKTR